MISELLNKLSQSGLIFVRTIKAFFTRRLSTLVAKVRQMTNITRGASKVATTSIQTAAAGI